MTRGTIKTLTDRGYGFINPDEGEGDVFFHRTGLTGITFEGLHQGDRVTYAAEAEPRGNRMRATNVSVVAPG